MEKLSVTIITHNEESNISKCLDAVKEIADEIIVVDSFSTDRTAEICREAGCRVFEKEFEGFGLQKQFAVDHARNNWILSVDADEIISRELRREISGLLQQERIPYSGYSFKVLLCYLGRVVRFSGSEMNLRLFDRRVSSFTLVRVHESVIVKGKTGVLKEKMIHYSYRDISHHLDKINFYTTRAAEENIIKGKNYRKIWVALKFPISFITFYFIRGCILDGYPGFMWSLFAAFYGSVKIAKTIEMQAKQ
jgi:glycosyltransferase involved in cell wall biosynthesis